VSSWTAWLIPFGKGIQGAHHFDKRHCDPKGANQIRMRFIKEEEEEEEEKII